jgi:hypothetical protein
MKGQPQAKTVWRIEIREAGAISSQLLIWSATDKPLTAEQAAQARLIIDEAFGKPENKEWLEAMHPWVISDDLRIWWRGIGGSFPETRAIVARLNKTNLP